MHNTTLHQLVLAASLTSHLTASLWSDCNSSDNYPNSLVVLMLRFKAEIRKKDLKVINGNAHYLMLIPISKKLRNVNKSDYCRLLVFQRNVSCNSFSMHVTYQNNANTYPYATLTKQNCSDCCPSH